MKKKFVYLIIAIICISVLFSGAQTLTGYFSDPSGYGFYHIQTAYFQISVVVTLLGLLIMVVLVRRAERSFISY